MVQLFPQSHVMTGWEVAGEYVYTTPGDQDVDSQMLTLNVPGYRSEVLFKWIGYTQHMDESMSREDVSCSTGCLSLYPKPVKIVSCRASPSFLRPHVRPTAPFLFWRWGFVAAWLLRTESWEPRWTLTPAARLSAGLQPVVEWRGGVVAGQSGQTVVLLPDPEEYHRQLHVVVSTHRKKQRGGTPPEFFYRSLPPGRRLHHPSWIPLRGENTVVTWRGSTPSTSPT